MQSQSRIKSRVVLSWSRGKDPAWTLHQQSIDPCGENRAFHIFIWNGTMFSRTIYIEAAETVEGYGFIFTGLIFMNFMPMADML